MESADQPELRPMLRTAAWDTEEIVVESLSGVERLSELPRFDVVIARPGVSETELTAVLTNPCDVSFGPLPGDSMRGVVERVEERAEGRLHLSLIPTVALLNRCRHSRVHTNVGLRDLADEILSAYGLHRDADYRLALEPGPVGEALTQYRETDWAFLERHLARSGCFYWFSYDEAGERLHVADNNAETLPGTPRELVVASGGATGGDAIAHLGRRRQTIFSRVGLTVESEPGHARLVRADADPVHGFGTWLSFGDNPASEQEASELAGLRAEHWLMARHTVFGETSSVRLRPGSRYAIAHPRNPELDGNYLIIEAQHTCGASGSYGCRFEAVPLDVPFRPRPIAAPRMTGLVRGRLVGGPIGRPVGLDPRGRLAVQLPFMEGAQQKAPAVRAVPLGGTGRPPLNYGDTVLVGHLDGDPDRPVVVGTPSSTDQGPTRPDGVEFELIPVTPPSRVD